MVAEIPAWVVQEEHAGDGVRMIWRRNIIEHVKKVENISERIEEEPEPYINENEELIDENK